MAFWNKKNLFPYTNNHDENLDYMMGIFEHIKEEWASLYETLTGWKNTTTEELETWKNTVENDMNTWEQNLRLYIVAWKDNTEQDISEWETAVLSDLNTWRSNFETLFNTTFSNLSQIKTDAEAARDRAETAATSAEENAESISDSAAQIAENANDIDKLNTQITNELNATAVIDSFVPAVFVGEGLTTSGSTPGKNVTNSKNTRTGTMNGSDNRCAISFSDNRYEYRMFYFDENGSIPQGNAIGYTDYISGSWYIPSTAKKIALSFKRKDLADMTAEDGENIQSALTIYNPTDKTLNIENRSADAFSTGIVADSEDTKTNLLNNLIDYGYGVYEHHASKDNTNVVLDKIDVKRSNSMFVVNLPNSVTSAIRIKLNGNLGLAAKNAEVEAWTNGLILETGHRYRAYATLISGTVQGSAERPVDLSVYFAGTRNLVGLPDGAGAREFIYDGTPINIVLYIYSGSTLINAKYQLLLKDITKAIENHDTKPTLSKSQKQDILDLIDEYMEHDTDTKYNTSTTWNYYTSKSRTYDNGRLQVCCSSFAQLIWAGISPDTFFVDPTNYDGDIIKAFDWGYNMPFIARQRAGGLAIRENNVITGYYGFHQGDTDKDSYSHTTYYQGSSDNPNHQNFRIFMYAADIAAELCMAGYEIPISDVDVGDLLFYKVTDYAITPFVNTNFRYISHVAVVTGKTNGFFEIAESVGVYEDRGIFRTSIFSEDDLITARAAGMMKNLVMATRHPSAYGVAGNVPNKFTTIPMRVSV